MHPEDKKVIDGKTVAFLDNHVNGELKVKVRKLFEDLRNHVQS